MPLSQVRAGMQGQGLTVVRGTKVEPFDVEVLGVVPNAGPTGDLILVRVGGPLIEETGGIASGMSGSPVYVDGRLIGAVSYGFSFSDHRVGFLTPIERMLQVLDRARTRDGSPRASEEPERPLPDVVTLTAPVPVPPATPLATPLMVSGAGDRVLRRLAALTEPLGYRVELGGRFPAGGGSPVPADSGADAARNGERLEPGSAFGAALVTGDMSVTAIGTVTYTEGDYFVGFGHPFLNRGPVALPVSLAEIYQTVRSQEAPFKLGAPRQFTGTLLEDRPAGVAGKMSGLPPGIAARIAVEDLDRREKTSFQVTVAADETMATDLLALAALQGLDKGLARIGQGTAEVRLALRGDGLPGGEIVRENTFYSGFDVSAAALRDLLQGVALVATNPFRQVALREVELSVKATDERRTGVVERARLVQERPVRPGEAAEVEVLVRPYRGEVRRERLSLTVPDDLPAGRYVILVHGGGASGPGEAGEDEEAPPEDGGHAPSPDPEKLKPAPPKTQEPKTNAESFEDLIDQFVKRDRNNELVAQLVRAGMEEGEGLDEGLSETPAKPAGHPAVRRTGAPVAKESGGGRSPAKARLSLPYVVLGRAEVGIEVGKGGSPNPPLKAPPAPRWERPLRD